MALKRVEAERGLSAVRGPRVEDEMKSRSDTSPGPWWLLAGLVLVLAFSAGSASAKKPAPPPPAPDPADTGVISFLHNNAIYEMDTDGTPKVDLELFRVAGSLDHEASEALYGGKRWFLQKRHSNPAVFDPYGGLRWELYAVSQGGATVLLFSEENVDLEHAGSIGWATRDGVTDGKISFSARRFVAVTDPDTGEVSYVVDEYGIYVAAIDANDLAEMDAAGLAVQGASLDLDWSLLPLEFYLKNDRAFSVGYDWSPDGTALVYTDGYLPAGGIWVTEEDSLGWSTPVRISSGGGARWSNDGTQLAFLLGGDLSTMNADGTGVETVLEDPEDSRKYIYSIGPRFCWSPSDTHLIYLQWELYVRTKLPSPYKSVDIHRVELTGSGGINDVNLTDDTDAYLQIIGWNE